MNPTTIRHSLVHLRPKRRFRAAPVPFEAISRTDQNLGPSSDAAPAPADLAFSAASPASSAVPVATQAAQVRKRVLVVDNEPTCTRMVRLTLERSNLFEICEVNDPLDALAVARRFQPHLVLLDIEMPGLDGSAVAKQLRNEKVFRHLPILFMTSLVTPEEADHPLYAAGSRVLAKPVTISKLMQSVAEMLGNILTTGRPAPAA